MLIDNQVTRLENGVTNVNANDIFNSLRYPTTLGYHAFLDDFFEYVVNRWTVTETQAGATQGIADGQNGGVIALVNTAADDDLNAIQRVNGVRTAESWLIDPTKKFYMECRVALSDILQSDMIAGLQITDVTPLAVSDGFFFRKVDGSAVVNFVSVKNSNETLQQAGSLAVNNQFQSLKAFWDGQGVANGRLYAGIDDAIFGFVSPGANFPDDEALTVSFAVQNGEAVAKTLFIDRIFIAQEV